MEWDYRWFKTFPVADGVLLERCPSTAQTHLFIISLTVNLDLRDNALLQIIFLVYVCNNASYELRLWISHFKSIHFKSYDSKTQTSAKMRKIRLKHRTWGKVSSIYLIFQEHYKNVQKYYTRHSLSASFQVQHLTTYMNLPPRNSLLHTNIAM